MANPDGTFGVSHSASQAEAMAAAQSNGGGGSYHPGNGNKGNKGNKGGGAASSASQAQSQTVNVNIINAPRDSESFPLT